MKKVIRKRKSMSRKKMKITTRRKIIAMTMSVITGRMRRIISWWRNTRITRTVTAKLDAAT
jgi:hypothetical protein